MFLHRVFLNFAINFFAQMAAESPPYHGQKAQEQLEGNQVDHRTNILQNVYHPGPEFHQSSQLEFFGLPDLSDT
ncbi:hypothetical protein PC123_g15026 [Phytophthora cactorum]|nr:hypothetical protein PC120_g14936 [Phytophthora cactorum]KAG4049698.1 hypothetical protein PC123_g15026 [Phytophthora cactorum]